MHTWRRCSMLAALLATALVTAWCPPAQGAVVIKNVIDLPAGSGAARVAIDPTDDRVYVANGVNKVHVYSADLATAHPDIVTGAGVFGLAIDSRPASHRLFVARYPGTVEVYGLPGGGLQCAFPGGGGGLNALVFDPDTEKLFVAVESLPKISVAAGPGNCSLTSFVTTHDKPLDIALDRQAGRVYAPIHHANELAVVDTVTHALTQFAVLAGNPFGVAADGINHRVYVAQNLGNAIVDVDSGPLGQGPYTQTNLLVGDAPASVEVDPALDTAYVGIRNFAQLRPVTDDVVKPPIGLGFTPGKPAVNATSHCVYVPGNSGPTAKLARLCHDFSSVIAEDNPQSWFGLGEGSGTTMTATAGGKTGRYQNGVVLGQPGAIAGGGSAALFNGTSSYAYVNGIAAPKQAYTMEISMKPGAPLKAGTMIDHGGGGALYMQTNSVCFRQTQTHVCWPTTPSTSSWTHVAGTWDAISNTARLYVNGVLRASGQAPSAPSGNGTLYIGYGQSASWFKGLLDEAAYFPTALSQTRIELHYHAGCGC